MLASLVTWILKNYIGEYIELNTEQITIALLNGKVDLQNVAIKKNAFRKFDMPLGVRAGIIGKLSLQIPIIQIRSQPWVLKMQDLSLLLCRPSLEHDIIVLEQYNEQRKGWFMDEIELHQKRQILAAMGLKKDEESENKWWGTYFAATVSNNIQIILQNLHIRYEDFDDNGVAFSFGIQIKQLHIQTTNQFWRPEFVQHADDQNIFKKFDFTGLNFYWNYGNGSQKFSADFDISNSDSFKEFMTNCLKDDNSMILRPFSAEVRIEKNSSKLPLQSVPSIPRFKVDIRSTKLELELSAEQNKQIRCLFRRWALFDRSRKHRKWRPKFTIKERPRIWWRFSISRVMDEIKSRSFTSLGEAFLRAKHFNAYCEAYERRLKIFLETSKANGSLNAAKSLILQEDAALIKQIEHDTNFSINDLQLFRDVVFRKVLREIHSTEVIGHNSLNYCGTLSGSFISVSDQISQQEQHDISEKSLTPLGSSSWMGWMTGWLYGSTEPSTLPTNDADVNEALYLHIRPTEPPRHFTYPEFQKIEKRMEAELVQMLNDSFDESTMFNVLMRDNILAELVFKIESVFVRFSNQILSPLLQKDKEDHLLTCDVRQLCCRSHVSLKEHRTELSVSVGDMSVQQLQIVPKNSLGGSSNLFCAQTPADSPKDNTNALSSDCYEEMEFLSENADVDADEESLLYGFRNPHVLNTQVLLTIGRAYDKLLEFTFNQKSSSNSTSHKRNSPSKKRKNGRSESLRNQKGTPFLQVFYKRFAPKSEVLHEINIKTLPVSVICVENSLHYLQEFFDIGKQEEFMDEFDIKTTIKTDLQTINQVFLTICVPKVIVELRNKKAVIGTVFLPNHDSYVSTLPQVSPDFSFDSAPFARFYLNDLKLFFSNEKSNQLCKINVNLKSFSIEDLFEAQEFGEEDPKRNSERKFLLKTGLIMLNNENVPISTSTSCPDLTAPIFENLHAFYTPKKSTNRHQFTNFSYSDHPQFTSIDPSFTNPSSLSNKKKRILDDLEAKISTELVSDTIPHTATSQSGFFTFSGRSDEDGVTLEVILIDKNHPLFSSKYNNKRCFVKSYFCDDTELRLSRRTWALLIEFFGFLGSVEDRGSLEEAICERYKIEIHFEFPLLRTIMHYSNPNVALGELKFSNLALKIQSDVGDVTPIEIDVEGNHLHLTDLTPHFSTLYKDRLIVRQSDVCKRKNPNGKFFLPAPIFRIKATKSRDSENVLVVDVKINEADVCYVHTHRHLCSLLEFWMHFFDIQNRIQLQNSRLYRLKHISAGSGSNIDVDLFDPYEKMRLMLSLQIVSSKENPLRTVIPLHSHSKDVVILESERLEVKTQWSRDSNIAKYLAKHSLITTNQEVDGQKDNYDCLLEIFKINFVGSTLRGGFYSNRARTMDSRNHNLNFDWKYSLVNGIIFSNSRQISIGTPTNFLVDFGRNLSSLISHKVPDLFIVCKIDNSSINLQNDFYKVLRGCINHNFGEQIIPNPETIPFELLLLQEICNLSFTKYISFALRLVLHNIQISFAGQMLDIAHGDDLFALLQLTRGRIQFNSFVDPELNNTELNKQTELNQRAELDLILESAGTRLMNVQKNSYKCNQVLCTRSATHSAGSNEEHVSSKNRRLLFETHVIFAKDSSIMISMVLINARILLYLDWLNMFWDFIFSTSDYVPPPMPSASTNTQKDLLLNMGSMLYVSNSLISSFGSFQPTLEQIQKKEVLTAEISETERVTIKTTLKECELIAVEQPTLSESFAFVIRTTAAIMMNHVGTDEMEAQLELQNVELFRCMMTEEPCRWCPLANEFRSTICYTSGISTAEPVKQVGGMEEALSRRRQSFVVNLDTLNSEFSPSDVVIICEVFSQTLARFASYQECIALLEQQRVLRFSAVYTLSSFQPSIKNSFSTSFRFSLYCRKATIAILDDSVSLDRTALLFRLGFRELNLQQVGTKIKAQFELALDIYNRSHFGWETLIEWWQVKHFELYFSNKSQFTMEMESSQDASFDLSISEFSIKQMRFLWTQWESIMLQKLDTVRSKFSTCSKITDTTSEVSRQSNFVSWTEFDACVQLSSFTLSLIGIEMEELIFFRLDKVRFNATKQRDSLQLNCNVLTIQADNQLLTAERWQLFYCDPTVMREEQIQGVIPALIFEMRYVAAHSFDIFDCFRLKISSSCMMIEEHLLLKLIAFFQHVASNPPHCMCLNSGTAQQSFVPANFSNESSRQCYFGTLLLEIGSISLSAIPTEKSIISPELRQLKKRYNITLVGFENALVSVPCFHYPQYVGPYSQLISIIAKFYLQELQKQKLNIMITMDALGNPMGLATDVKDSFQGLLFEGDIGGFAFGLSYGAANSISKVASSVATGLGKLTFDQQHEQLRRRMIRSQSQTDTATPLTYLYGGMKGLGVGVFGGLTAIVRNTITATSEDGVTGIVRGVATGTIDTVMKPLQGVLDFVDGTASAVKEAVGSPLDRKIYFSESRLRMPRCCSSLSGLLPPFSEELSLAQQDLLQISQSRERLLATFLCLDFSRNKKRVVYRALLGSEQCYVLTQIDDQPQTVVQRIVYKYLKSILPAPNQNQQEQQIGPVPVEVIQTTGGIRHDRQSSSIICTDLHTAKKFCKEVLIAKRHFETSQQRVQLQGSKKPLSTTIL